MIYIKFGTDKYGSLVTFIEHESFGKNFPLNFELLNSGCNLISACVYSISVKLGQWVDEPPVEGKP